MNKTQHHKPQPQFLAPIAPLLAPAVVIPSVPHGFLTTNIPHPNPNTNTNTNTQMIQQIKNNIQKKTQNPCNYLIPKQKRTLRRKYCIGRHPLNRKIGVLIKNQTMRTNISNKKQLLKQVPIEEIKTYLIKNGLIRVGTQSPHDVLRQIYECSVLIGGEICNHNTDNLLYNYLNQ